MNPSQIVAAVNDCSHRIAFDRACGPSGAWTLEAERGGRWMPGVVISPDIAHEAIGALTPMDTKSHVFFYPSLRAALAFLGTRAGGVRREDVPLPMRFALDMAARANLVAADAIGYSPMPSRSVA